MTPKLRITLSLGATVGVIAALYAYRGHALEAHRQQWEGRLKVCSAERMEKEDAQLVSMLSRVGPGESLEEPKGTCRELLRNVAATRPPSWLYALPEP